MISFIKNFKNIFLVLIILLFSMFSIHSAAPTYVGNSSYDYNDPTDNDGYYKQGQTIVWRVDIDHSSIIEVSCDEIPFGQTPIQGGRALMSWIGGSGSTNYYTHNWSTTGEPNGRHQIAIWVKYDDGGAQVWSTTVGDIWLRNTIPAVTSVVSNPANIMAIRRLNETVPGSPDKFVFTFNVSDMDQNVAPVVTLGTNTIMPQATEWTTGPDKWNGQIDIYSSMEASGLTLSISGAKDKYGNTMTTYNYPSTFTIDTTKPQVSGISSNPDDPFKNENVNFTIDFTEDMDTNVAPSLTFGGVAVPASGWQGSTKYVTGSFDISAQGWTIGSKDLVIQTAQDTAGNAMLTHTSSFDFDPTSPKLINIVTSPAAVNGNKYSAGTLTFTLTFDENMKTDATTVVKLGSYTLTKTSFSGDTWIGTIDISSAMSGTYNIDVISAQDLAKNNIDASADSSTELTVPQTYDIDGVKPNVSSLTPNTTSTLPSGANTIVIKFSESMDTATYPTVTINSQTVSAIASPWTTTTNANDTWTGTITVTEAMNGSNLTVSIADAKDLYGNIMTPNTSYTYNIDATLPTISSVSPVTDSFIDYDATTNITVTFSKSMDIANPVYVTLGTKVATAGYWSGNQWKCQMNPNTTGLTTLSISGATDNVGNKMAINSDTKYTVDSIDPQVSSVTTSPIAPFKSEIVTFDINFSESMDTTAPVSVTLDGYSVANTSWTNSDKKWTGTISIPAGFGSPPGNKILYISDFKDKSGRYISSNPTYATVGVSSNLTYKVDTETPVVYTVDPTPGGYLPEGGKQFTIVFNYGDMDTAVMPTVTLGSLTPSAASWTGNVTWTGTFTITSDLDGQQLALSASGAQDEARNVMTTYTSTNYTVDTGIPTISTIEPADNASVGLGVITDITLTFSKAMDISIPVYLTLGSVGALNETGVFNGHWNGNTKWQCQIVPAGSGGQTVTITNAFDSHGFEMTANTSYHYNVDSTMPQISAVSLSPTAPVHAETVTFTIDFDEKMDTTSGQVTIDGIYVTANTPAWSNNDTTWTGTRTLSSSTWPTPKKVVLSAIGFKDEGGNPLDPDPDSHYEFIIDTVKPSVSSITPANGSYLKEGANEFVIVFKDGTMESTVMPTVTLGGTAPTSANWTGNVTWTGTFNISTSQDGQNLQLSVTNGEDEARNVMYDNTSNSYNVDTTLPAITVTLPIADSAVNNYNLTYSLSEKLKEGTVEWTWTGGTADSNSPHECSFDGTELYSGSHGPAAIRRSPGTDDGPADLAQMGIYTVKFSGIDFAGNEASQVSITNVTYDTKPPDFSPVKPEKDSFVNNTRVSYDLSEDIVDGTIEWTQIAGATDPYSPHAQKLDTSEMTIGAHSNILLTNNPTLVDQAQYKISFSGVDSLGNKATKTLTSDRIVYDVTAPEVEYVYSHHANAGPTYFKNGDTIDLFVRIKTPSPDYFNDNIYTEVTADFSSIMAGQDNVTSYDSIDGTFELQLTLSGATEGLGQVILINAKDRADNYTQYSYAIGGIDNTAPTITSVTSPDTDTIYRNGEKMTVQVECDEPGLTVSADLTDLVASGVTRYQVNDIGSGNYKLEFTFPDNFALNTTLSNKTIKIYARDAASNESTNTSFTATLDNEAPSIASAIYSSTPSYVSGGSTYIAPYYADGKTITFDVNTSESGLTLTADLSTIDNRFDKTTHGASLLSSSGGTYTLEYIIDPTNGYSDRNANGWVYAYDTAGNYATKDITYEVVSGSGYVTTITLDTTKPSFESETQRVVTDKAAYKDNEVVNFIINLSEKHCSIETDFSEMDSGWGAGNVSITNRDENLTTGTEEIQAQYQITASNNKNDGVYNVPVTATDLAGNFRTYYSLNLQLDNQGPQMVGGYVLDEDKIYKNGDNISLVSLWDSDNYTVSANFSALDDTQTLKFACSYDGQYAANQEKYKYLNFPISALNGVGDGSCEVVFTSRDLNSNENGNGAVEVYLDNTAPEITTSNWIQVERNETYLNDTDYVGIGSITVEVKFNENISVKEGELPKIKITENSYEPKHDITILEPYTTNYYRYDNSANTIYVAYEITGASSLRNGASIDVVVEDYYDIAGNMQGAPTNNQRQVFYFDNDVPVAYATSFDMVASASTENQINSSPYNSTSDWYLKYKSTDLLHSNITSVSVEVKIYENTQINELKLYWQEDGGHQASKDFDVLHKYVNTPGYYTAGVNISIIKDAIVPADISETDTITFWIGGKDLAGNTFQNYISSGDSLATSQLHPIVSLTSAIAEINNRWVVPAQANVDHYYAVRFDMRYYDTGVNRIVIDTPDFGTATSASFMFNDQAKAGSFDFNGNKVTYYLTNAIDEPGTAEITFQLTTKSSGDSPTGENYPCNIYNSATPSYVVTATAGNADDGEGRVNDDTIVITQALSTTTNAEIKPHTVAVDSETELEYTFNSTFDSNSKGINRYIITIPSTHAVKTVLLPADITIKSAAGIAIPSANYNVTLDGGVSSGGWTWGTKLIIDFLNSVYDKETQIKIIFNSKSFTDNDSSTGGKYFSSKIDYYILGSRTSEMSVVEQYLKATNIITQPIVNGGTLSLVPTSSLKNITKSYTATINTIFESGSAGVDTFILSDDSLEITDVTHVEVNNTGVSFNKTFNTGSVAVQLFNNISSNSDIDITFTAKSPNNYGVVDFSTYMENSSNHVTADCTPNIPVRIGVPIDALYPCDTTIGVWVNDEYAGTGWNNVPPQAQTTFETSTKLKLFRENAGVNKITINCDPNLTSPQLSKVYIKGEKLDATDYSAVLNGNDIEITLKTVQDIESFGETEDKIRVFFTAVTPLTLNYPLVIKVTLDNSYTSSPKIITPSNTIYVKQILTHLKGQLNPHYVQTNGEHTYKVKFGTFGVSGNYVSTTDVGYDKITFSVPDHTLFTFKGISEDNTIATAWWSPSPPYVPGVYTLERIKGSNGIDQITDETVEIEFTAVSPGTEDYPDGVNVSIEADHSLMVKPITSEPLKTGDMTIISTSSTSSISATVSPSQTGVDEERVLTFTIVPQINSSENVGINQLVFDLGDDFSVQNANGDLNSPTANITVNNVPYAIDNSNATPLSGKAYIQYISGSPNKVSVTLGDVISSVGNIIIGFRLKTANTEGNFQIGISANNTEISGSGSVDTNVTVSTRKSPCLNNTLYSEVEKQSVGPGNYKVMAGTTEVFTVFSEFQTDANSSGVNLIEIGIPTGYSSISVDSVKLKTDPAGGFSSISYNDSIDSSNLLSLNLNTTIGASSAGAHTAEVQLTAITPFVSGFGTFSVAVDSLGFPNKLTAGCKDINENGRGSCEIEVVSNVVSVTGEIQPRNVMANSGVRFSASVTPVFNETSQGLDTIKITVPDGYTISQNPTETIKYVFFGGSVETEVNSSISGQIITVNLLNGHVINYNTEDKRINVVFEAIAPLTTDIDTGGKQFKIFVDRLDTSNIPATETGDSMHVYASLTTIDSLTTEIKPSKKKNWNVFFTINFSVGMDTTVEPKVSFKPLGIDELKYDIEQVSYYGNIWMGGATISYREDIISKFSGTLEVKIENVKDEYGNIVAELTKNVNMAPGFIVTAFQNPIVKDQLSVVVKSSEKLLSGSPEVSINYNGNSDTIYMSEISNGYYRGFTSVNPSKHYSTDVYINVLGKDMLGTQGSAQYTFTVAKLSAPKGGKVSSPDKNFNMDVPENALPNDQIVYMLENKFSDNSAKFAKVANASPQQVPEISEKSELIALSKIYSPAPVQLKFRKQAVVKADYDTSQLKNNSIKKEQVALFGWNGKKWIYMNSKSYTGKVESNSSVFMPYMIMADIVKPKIKNVFPDPDQKLISKKMAVRANVIDNGSGINNSKTKILIDNNEVKYDYNEDTNLIEFIPSRSLELGEHEFRIETEDNVGNKAPDYVSQFVIAGSLGINTIVVYPNPSDVDVYFSYTLTSNNTEQVIIKIYDVYGDNVTTLYGSTDIGRNTDGAIWDLRNDNGEEVANGVYLYTIEVKQGDNNIKETGKITVLK